MNFDSDDGYVQHPSRCCLVDRILCALFPRRDIVTDGDLYLRRWFLTPRSWPWRIFIHHIMRSDRDRHLHDHPWDFSTLIVNGSYLEHLPHGTRIARPGMILHNKAEHTHRIELQRPMWTVLFVGRPRRVWGFHTEAGWVDYRTYLGIPNRREAIDAIAGGKQCSS